MMLRLARSHPIPFWLLGLLWLAAVGTAVPTQAQTDSAVTLTVQAGYDGYYKPGFWTPVHITAANDGPAIEGKLRIVTGSAAAGDRLVYDSPISLPTQSNKRVTLYVHLSSFVTQLNVELLDEDGRTVTTVASNRLSQLGASELLYGVVSPEPGELEFLEDVNGRRIGAGVAFLTLADLPAVPAAWNALDVLVFNDVDSGQLTPAQLDALRGWISTGGQLVVTGGPGWQKTAAAFTDLLPVTLTGSESVADLPALTAETGEPFRDPGPYLVATGSLRQGELLFHQEGLPLLAQTDYGQGSVYFLALDPQLAPLLDWDGNEQLWAPIAAGVPEPPPWGEGIKDSFAAITAVSSLPSLSLPSVAQLALFLTIYVLAVGPINYWILKRRGRRELAWASIPIIILFFTGLAYATGFQLKGNNVILNQMSVAYGQVGGQQMRTQTILGLYSPRRASYDLTLPANSVARPFERGFSGGISGSGNVEAISRGSDLLLEEVRVDVSGTETFLASSYQPQPAISGDAALTLAENEIRLNATLTNNSDVSLQTATLLIGSRVVEVGDLEPGEVATISERVGSAETDPASLFVTGAGFGSPLISNADKILGTPDYFNDRDAYPRWQLLESLVANNGSGSFTAGNTVTLIGWSERPQLDVALTEESFDTMATTLYFLELPLAQNSMSGRSLSAPVSMLNWEVLAESAIRPPSIRELYLQGDWVAFEYQPLADFQEMTVEELAVTLKPGGGNQTQPLPQIQLWDWQQETWVTMETATWGQFTVSGADRFIGPANAVRVKVHDVGQNGIEIETIYPVLTGIIP